MKRIIFTHSQHKNRKANGVDNLGFPYYQPRKHTPDFPVFFGIPLKRNKPELLSGLIFSVMLFAIGCARVRVEAPKEPIKVDISMRLDVYQHVTNDINAIEDIVSGAKKGNKPSGKQGLLDYFVSSAYAQEGLSSEAEQAALRRRDRLADLNSWQEKGVIGENKSGLVEIRSLEKVTSNTEELIKAENYDRMTIYRSIAQKNGIAVEEVQRLYASRLQGNAPIGTPIEVLNQATGIYEWKQE